MERAGISWEEIFSGASVCTGSHSVGVDSGAVPALPDVLGLHSIVE